MPESDSHKCTIISFVEGELVGVCVLVLLEGSLRADCVYLARSACDALATASAMYAFLSLFSHLLVWAHAAAFLFSLESQSGRIAGGPQFGSGFVYPNFFFKFCPAK